MGHVTDHVTDYVTDHVTDHVAYHVTCSWTLLTTTSWSTSLVSPTSSWSLSRHTPLQAPTARSQRWVWTELIFITVSFPVHRMWLNMHGLHVWELTCNRGYLRQSSCHTGR